MNEGNEVIYTERQKFSPLLLWFINLSMVLAIVISILALMKDFSGRNPPAAREILIAVLAGIIVPIGISILFTLLKMETQVRSDGLYIRFFPFHIHFRKFSPDDIDECHARQYRPILEYGGWGIRCGLSGNGRAYNVSGNKGVQLVLKNGRRLLVGSQRALELEKAILSIKKL